MELIQIRKNLNVNYLESEKFFSKFSYFLEGKMKISGIFLESENFQNLKMIDLNQKVKIFKEIKPKSGLE